MKLHKKLYWQLTNRIEAVYRQLKGGRGLLRHRDDERDYVGAIGGIFGDEKTAVESLDWIKSSIWFDQKWFNICVFAAFTMALSHQTGIRFSVKWLVKLARREGYISGNGWSFLRAALKCANSYGMLPYELMPDEITSNDFSEYSRWTPDCDALLQEAEKFKIAEYRLVNRAEVLKVMPVGYLIFTAVNWYSGMNNPQPPLFLLEQTGGVVGGHAINITGWKNFAQYFTNQQTFGQNFGDNGKGYFRSLWGSGKFATYMFSQIPVESRLEHFKKFYDGWMVRTKTTPACYVIKDGKKWWVPTMEIFSAFETKYPNKYDNEVRQDVLDLVEQGGDYILPTGQE